VRTPPHASLLLLASACQAPAEPAPVAHGPSVWEELARQLVTPAPSDLRTAAGAPGPGYWQQRVDYTIEATLDPEARSVAGRALLAYTNHSPHALDALWLLLDQNLYREGSLGARLGAQGFGVPGEAGAGIELLALRADGSALEFEVYDTVARVELPEPIEPRGGTLAVEIEYRFRIASDGVLRHGVESVAGGPIFELAQWFPCAAVYDDVHGWNTLPYLGGGEFYTDFGDYDVRLTVPHDYLVVATGELKNPEEVFTEQQRERLARARASAETVWIRAPEEVLDPSSRPVRAGQLTWHFRAARVRTFAWAASPAFVLDAAAAAGVLCQSAYPVEALPLWRKSTQMVRAAVDVFSRHWRPYPFPVATSVSGCEDGMEYPMIVFCREREDEELLWEVTAHEIAHAWFPMLVNTDERRHAWMDEGLVSFMAAYAGSAWHGKPALGIAHPPNFVPALTQPGQRPILAPPDALGPDLVGIVQYGKAAMALVLLREEVLGAERFDRALRAYIDRWAYKSPRPADFFRCIEDASGADLGWFWRGWLAGTGVLDQAVVLVRQAHKRTPAEVVFASVGEVTMPLTYRAMFTDGTSVERRLPAEVWQSSRAIRETVGEGKRLRGIVVDPHERLPDVDRGNNAWGRVE